MIVTKPGIFSVVLTGGIASGKTLVSDTFASLGVPIIDTDVIAHDIVEPGQPALLEIRESFGEDVIDDTGRLNRPYLRSLIFSKPDERKKLESILHPKIRQKVMGAIAKITSDYCILVIPLLAEKGAYPNVDRVLVVDTSNEVQIKRLMQRDNCSLEQAQLALKSQASREQRLKIADDVLENSGTPGQVREKVTDLHKKYLQLATRGRAAN